MSDSEHMEMDPNSQFIVNFEYNGRSFDVQMNSNTLSKINSDDATRDKYIKACYEQLLHEEAEDDGVGNALGQANACVWSPENIKMLCTLRLSWEHKFNNPKSKKNKIWRDLANEFTNLTGWEVTGHSCDVKYRNMLSTYRINKKKQHASGEGCVTWEYFELFDSYLGYKASSYPNSNTLADSAVSIEESTSNTNESIHGTGHDSQDSDEGESDAIQPAQNQEIRPAAPRGIGRRVRKKKEHSVSQYFYLKREDDERRFKIKMAMKEREIDAILALANALSNADKIQPKNH